MSYHISIKLTVYFFIFINVRGFAQQTIWDKFSISKITPDNGLSQGSNYFRYEDSKGYMWITCNDALNRYDGNKIKVYNLNTYFKNCPILQQGYGFAEDAEGNIYIGSTKGLYLYHRNQDKFSLQKIFTNSPDEVAMPFGYKDGKIWCFNRQWQLATYDVVTKKVKLITKVALLPLNSVHVYQLEANAFYYHFPFIDKEGNCWLFANNNIARYSITLKKTTYPLETYLYKKKATIYGSAYDAFTNHILLGTANGLLCYNIGENNVEEIVSLAGEHIGLLSQIGVGGHFIVLKTDRGGLAFTTKDFAQGRWIEPDGREKYKRSFQFAFDKSDRLWFCDDGQGQIIFNFQPPLLNKEPGDEAAFQELISNGVGGFAEWPNGDILIQNKFIQNKNTHRLSHSQNIILKGKNLYKTATDYFRKGIWFYNAVAPEKKDANIFFLDQKDEISIVFPRMHADTLGVLQDVKVMPDGRVFFASTTGLYRLVEKTKSLSKIQQLRLPNAFFINLLARHKMAVSYLNNDMMLAEVLANDDVMPIQKILPGIQSFYIQEDTLRQRYWVGANNGLYLLDKNLKTLKLFDANNGLAGTYIYGLLLDKEGNAWCSHQRGLSSINTQTFQIINYDKSDGIQDWDFNNRSFFKASDGTMFFGGVSGYNYFKPPLKPYSFYEPEVYVDEILVNNKTFYPDTNANLLTKLALPFTENNIVIKAGIKDLDNSGIQQLIYRLRTTDNKWEYIPNYSNISFKSLAPGTYTLQLGYYDKYAKKERIQKTILISIAAPIYKKSWFWALIAVLLTGIIFWLINRRKLMQQQVVFRQQLALEKQRTKITADLHDDIGASLSSLQVNSAVANRLLDIDKAKAKTLLGKIEAQAKDLADKIGDIIWSMKPGKEEFMTMSMRIKNFANDILGATNIDYELDIDKTCDTSITDITARKNIVFITKEAINNCVKYSEATKVFIHLKCKPGLILLSVIDNGKGFAINKTLGNGITNMRRRTEELSGEFFVDSSTGNGTIIKVVVPLAVP